MRPATLAVVVLCTAIAVPASPSAPLKPSLRILGLEPLVVAGARFAPHEQVVVTAVTSLGPHAVRVRAGQVGSFRTTLGVFRQPCGKPFLVRARGVVSARIAIARIAPTPCVPPPIE